MILINEGWKVTDYLFNNQKLMEIKEILMKHRNVENN
jgi:hypothetical protein